MTIWTSIVGGRTSVVAEHAPFDLAKVKCTFHRKSVCGVRYDHLVVHIGISLYIITNCPLYYWNRVSSNVTRELSWSTLVGSNGLDVCWNLRWIWKWNNVCESHSVKRFCLLVFFSLTRNTGWPPKKKRNGILPVMQVYNDWYQWMGHFLPRKMIPRSAILVKVFFFILEHIMSDNVGFQNFPFSAKSWLGKKTLRLAIIVSDNPINSLCQWAFLTTAAYAPLREQSRAW